MPRYRVQLLVGRAAEREAAISLGLEALFASLPADGRLSAGGGGVCGGPAPINGKGRGARRGGVKGGPIRGATAGQAHRLWP